MLSWFSQREVKTPLAFYFRVTGAVVVIVIAALYFAPAEQRFRVFLIGLFALGLLVIVVALFAWLNVKNLVYGEAGHRAELRFKLGTEKGEISASALATTPGTSNPRMVPTAGTEKTLPGDSGAQ